MTNAQNPANITAAVRVEGAGVAAIARGRSDAWFGVNPNYPQFQSGRNRRRGTASATKKGQAVKPAPKLGSVFKVKPQKNSFRDI